MADTSTNIEGGNAAATPAAPVAPAPVVAENPTPTPAPAPAAPATPPAPAPAATGGRTGAPAYMNTQEAPAAPVSNAPAAPAPPVNTPAPPAVNTPAEQPQAPAAPAAEPTPSGFKVPESLTSFVETAAPAAPSAPAPAAEAPKPTDKVAVIGNYKTEAAKAISAHLAAGGEMADIQVYQQAESLQKMSDSELVVKDLMDKYGVAKAEAEAHIVGKYGKVVKDGEGNPSRVAEGLDYKIHIENAAGEIRSRIAGVVDKVNGALQAAPTPGDVPAQGDSSDQGQQAQDAGASPDVLNAASQAAREILSTNPTFDFGIKFGDGTEGTVKLGVPPEHADTAQQLMAASVMQARQRMKDNSPASIQQYHQDVQTSYARVIMMLDEKAPQTIWAAAEQHGFERAKREAAGVQGNNIYGSRGTSPSGNGTTLTPKQQAIREAKHKIAGSRR